MLNDFFRDSRRIASRPHGIKMDGSAESAKDRGDLDAAILADTLIGFASSRTRPNSTHPPARLATATCSDRGPCAFGLLGLIRLHLADRHTPVGQVP